MGLCNSPNAFQFRNKLVRLNSSNIGQNSLEYWHTIDPVLLFCVLSFQSTLLTTSSFSVGEHQAHGLVVGINAIEITR